MTADLSGSGAPAESVADQLGTFERGRADYRAGNHDNPFDLIADPVHHARWLRGYRHERELSFGTEQYVARRQSQEKFEP